jgi:uncharacterized protein YggT (Ycf19 family)
LHYRSFYKYIKLFIYEIIIFNVLLKNNNNNNNNNISKIST